LIIQTGTTVLGQKHEFTSLAIISKSYKAWTWNFWAIQSDAIWASKLLIIFHYSSKQ